MTDYDPEKEGLQRLQQADAARAQKPAVRPVPPMKLPPSITGKPDSSAVNVDTPKSVINTSNVDTSKPDSQPSNVDTQKELEAGSVGDSNVDTEAKSAATKSSEAAGSGLPSNVKNIAINVDTEVSDKNRSQLLPVDISMPAEIPAPTFKHRLKKPAAKLLSMDAVRRQAEDRLSKIVGGSKTSEDKGQELMLGSAEGMTRTEGTRQQYAKRGSQLQRRYFREKDIMDGTPLDPVGFAEWFVSLRPTLKSSSWRYYKQSALFQLTLSQSSDAQTAMDIIEKDGAYETEMNFMDNKSTPVNQTKTKGARVVSANKAKYFDFEDYNRLNAYLMLRGWGEKAAILKQWLRAALATGLRPHEWMATEIIEYPDPENENIIRTYLMVINAKHTNGRANGKFRTIEITNFTSDTMIAIRFMSENGRQWHLEGQYDLVQGQVAQVLYRADGILWPKRKTVTYALYSCRHQFILNQRELGVGEVELSAMLGHVVTDTQLTHYGKRLRGWSMDKILDKPKGYKDEMATIERRLSIAGMREKLEAIVAVKKKVRGPDVDQDIGVTFEEMDAVMTPGD